MLNFSFRKYFITASVYYYKLSLPLWKAVNMDDQTEFLLEHSF